MFPHKFKIILNYLHLCQSVSWLSSLLKLYKYKDISCSGWVIFLNFFGHISGMLIPQINIILIFFYVRQSVSWLTCLHKLYKYRDNSSSGWYIFLKLYRDIPWIFLHNFQIIPNYFYVCQSVSWLLPDWN